MSNLVDVTIERIAKLHNSWDNETKKLVDDLFGYWEAEAIDADVFRLRIEKVWPTNGSNLYSPGDIAKMTFEELCNIIK